MADSMVYMSGELLFSLIRGIHGVCYQSGDVASYVSSRVLSARTRVCVGDGSIGLS